MCFKWDGYVLYLVTNVVCKCEWLYLYDFLKYEINGKKRFRLMTVKYFII
jgi:hypothetical protein